LTLDRSGLQTLDGIVVGDTLAGTMGTWTGAPTLTYQWTRGADDIAGATTRVYILVDADVGSMIGYAVTTTNAGGSTTAASDPAGPVTEPAPPRRRTFRRNNDPQV
jgi:hypothetical protein